MRTWTDELPRSFPREFVITLRQGAHNGEAQLWAPLSHDGKNYKIVVSNRFVSRVMPKSGETWVVSNPRSPNGHIVFVRADWMQKTASGKHPVEAFALEWY